MTMPHEETWGDDYEVTVVGPRLERHEDIPREPLARAAPKMARALLHVARASVNERVRNEQTGKVDDMQQIVRAALTEAGVPLP